MKAKFTINQFNEMLPDEKSALEWAFIHKYGADTIECPQCKRLEKFYRIKDRKCFSCANCRYQIHPFAGTIFHKSSTTFRNWLFAIFLFSNSRNGVSAKELQRQLGVTYKTAWRMAKQIRKLFDYDDGGLGGTIEVDETYVGGKGGNNKRGRGAENKKAVIGMVERKGNVKAVVSADVKA